MTKVVYVKTSKKKPAKNHKAVVRKRVLTGSGQIINVSGIDANSATFGEDLRYVFGKNVTEARRENIAATGRADGVLRKP